MALELKQASPQEVQIYIPYYREPAKKTALPYAIGLYKQGELQGERLVENAPPVPFAMTWRPTNLPSDPVLCKVTFEGNPEMTYEVSLQNSEFVSYLIDFVIGHREKQTLDLPSGFYFRLFRMKTVEG